MDGLDLKVFASRPRGAWTLFADAVGAYALLVLREVPWLSHGGHHGIPTSFLGLQMLVFAGIALGVTDRHIALGMPFSFVLPGYRESLRRLSFSRAVRWGLLFALMRFSSAWWDLQLRGDWPSDIPLPDSMVGPSVGEISLNMAGGFLAGMAGCLLWTNRTLVPYHRRRAILCAGLGVVVANVAWLDGGRHPSIVWPVLIPLSVVICGFFWVRLADLGKIKDGHRAILVPEEQGGGPALEPAAPTLVEEFFVKRMRTDESIRDARFVWGWLYCVYGRMLSRWYWIVLSFLACVLVLGYVNRIYAYGAFVVLGTCMAHDVWFISSAALSPSGRRERRRLTLVSGILTTLLLVIVSGGGVGLSCLFETVLPSFSLGMWHLQYTSFDAKSILVACLPVPWAPLVVLILGAILWSVSAVWPFLILLLGLFFAIGKMRALHVTPSILLLSLGCGWVFFSLATWVNYRRWDLDRDEEAAND
jgi:hypothetical protein